MQPQPTNHVFFELLRFPVSELFLIRGGEVSLQHRGAFSLIHNSQLDLFLFKCGGIKFALNKSLQIIGAFSDEEKYPAYLIPSFDGLYMIKILDNTPNIALTNLETILSNTCEFRTKSGMEQKLGDVREMTLDSKIGVLKEVFHKTKDAIVKTLTPHDQHPNYTLLRTFEDMKNTNTDTIPVVDITPDELEKARSEADEVTRLHQGNKYWTFFSQYGEKSHTDDLLLSKLKTENKAEKPDISSRFNEETRLPSESTEQKHCDGQGCENISTMKVHHETERQEVVGTENQRLPSYEVHHSKEHVEEGLDKAVCRLEDAKFYQSCDLPPCGECQIPEDKSLTTGLLVPLGGDATKDPSDLHPKSESNRPLDYNGDPYRRNFADELNSFTPTLKKEESETWGSDVSNPSETPAKLSEAGLSTTSESFKESLGDRPLVISGNLTHSQSLTDKTLGASPTKGNQVFSQNVSEKQMMKQRNVSDQAVEKENATVA